MSPVDGQSAGPDAGCGNDARTRAFPVLSFSFDSCKGFVTTEGRRSFRPRGGKCCGPVHFVRYRMAEGKGSILATFEQTGEAVESRDVCVDYSTHVH